MHEMSLAAAIVDAALRHAGGRRVLSVRVRVGALRQALPEALAFCFELVAQGTICAGARLDQERIAVCLACRQCGSRSQVEAPPLRCRACGGGEVEVVAGDELEVESIVVEEPQCTTEA